MKWNKTNQYLTGGLILSGLAALGIHLFTRKKKGKDTFENESEEEKETSLDGGSESNRNPLGTSLIEPHWDNPFAPNFMEDVMVWVAPQKLIKLKDDYADQLAQKIRKAKGRFWISDDDEEAVSTVFLKNLKDKVQVANVSQAFFKRYNQDLLEFLKSFLNEGEMEKYVHQPIAKLKKHRTK